MLCRPPLTSRALWLRCVCLLLPLLLAVFASPARADDEIWCAARPGDLRGSVSSGLPLALSGARTAWTPAAGATRPSTRRCSRACACGRAARPRPTRKWIRASACQQHVGRGGLSQRRGLQGGQVRALISGCSGCSSARPSIWAARSRTVDARRQPAGRRRAAADNLVITVGKFSVTDIFDTNSYAHDPKGDFLNWSLIDAGAFDYAADAWGYSYGVAAEWNAGLVDLARRAVRPVAGAQHHRTGNATSASSNW